MTLSVRNAAFSSADGASIDVEYEHPVYGWVPFTARADDVEDLGREIYDHVKNSASPYSPPLLQVQAELTAAIDTAAEAERRKYITPGSGQAMTYMQKADEAGRCVLEADPDPENYPLLAAEIGVTAESLLGVAQVVEGAFMQWQVVGGQIEAARLAAKKAIAAAETVEEARAAAGAVSWPNT